MKQLILFALCVTLLSCQKEELTIVDGQNEESLALDGQLKELVSSVAAHDGSFDDVVDRSPCFSIDFPYQCTYNGHQYPMNTINDLEPWNKGDVLIPVFPINITFANYIQATVPNYEAFSSLIQRCADGELFNDIIGCVDFVYPFSVALYNPNTSNFQTITLLHDKQTFESVYEIDEDLLVSINYPIQLILENDIVITIESNEVLKNEILNIVPICE